LLPALGGNLPAQLRGIVTSPVNLRGYLTMTKELFEEHLLIEQVVHSETQAVMCTRAVDSSLAHAANILSDWAGLVITEIPQMSDDKVIETACTASELERQAFRVRGACAAELKRRIRARVGAGDECVIGKQMAKLAAEVGVSARTLDDDARIHEEFAGSDHFRGATEIPREFFRLALNAPDPNEAMSVAATKLASQQNYSTRDFRRDVALLKAGITEKEVEELHWLSLRLDAEAWGDLRAVKARFGCDDLTAVKLALKALSGDTGY
jgi:hypothetical protein